MVTFWKYVFKYILGENDFNFLILIGFFFLISNRCSFDDLNCKFHKISEVNEWIPIWINFVGYVNI